MLLHNEMCHSTGRTSVCLPSTLSHSFKGGPSYTGVAAFLTSHTALLRVSLSTEFASTRELARVFQDSTALPLLTDFILINVVEQEGVHSIGPIVTALATTAVGVSGSVRPIRVLHLDVLASGSGLAATAVMPALVELKASRLRPGWLKEWAGVRQTGTVFPMLERCELMSVGYAEGNPAAARDLTPFFQSLARSPVQMLHVRTGERVKFDAAASAQIVRMRQLREFVMATGAEHAFALTQWIDYCALGAAFTPGCFTCLREVGLQNVRMSAVSILQSPLPLPASKSSGWVLPSRLVIPRSSVPSSAATASISKL